MLLRDLMTLPLEALWQQKVRTLLTTLGVVFGAFVLAASLSVGEGVQDTIARESRRRDVLRRITVHPQWGPAEADVSANDVTVAGQMSDDRRERIRSALVEYNARLHATGPRKPLAREALAELAGLDHVEALYPVVRHYGYAVIGDRSENTQAASVRHRDPRIAARLIAGRQFESDGEAAAIVNEFLLYRMGIVGDADLERALGQKLRLEFRDYDRQGGFGLYLMKPSGEVTRKETSAVEKIRQRLPEALDKLDLTSDEIQTLRKALSGEQQPQPEVIVEEFTIVGVVRLPTAEENAQPWDPLSVDAEVLLPMEAAMELLYRMPGRSQQGADQAVLMVDSEDHVRPLFQRLKDLGYNASAPLEFVEQQRLMYRLIFGGMTCVAAVALLVAATGIANTMLMSVLERTREIGIMKAVGASPSQLVAVFLLEGALIGIVGGALGMLAAWAASFPGDAWVQSMVTRDLKIELTEAIFVFPGWVIATVLGFSVIITTLAAVYPARRAANIDAVTALRHE
jgi:putative ABC transport system permease protein